MPPPSTDPEPSRTHQPAPSAADVPEKLRLHYQYPGNFCAVSGSESIAKLEGLINPGDFPMQSDNTNIDKGFEPAHRTFLTSKGLDSRDEHVNSGREASVIIERETSAGRFPLVSMPVQNAENGSWGYHVFIFAKYRGEVLFIDPAVPKVILRGIDAVAVALENWRTSHPLTHRTVHVLTYSRRAENTEGSDVAS